MRWLSFLLSCCLLAPASAVLAAQATSLGDQGATTTIKTSTRVVLLDVLVTDKAAKPVRGLKASDFTVLEDGKPQEIRGFEERAPEMAASTGPVALNLPPNTYTNYATTPETGAINILLFDILNTDRQRLTIARQQLLLYLSKLPANTRVALFTLDSDLHLVHGFTDDPQELIEAAQHLSQSQHPMYSNARGVSDELGDDKLAGLTHSPAMYRSVSRFLWSENEGKEESRTLITMEALNQLARSMAVLPGRKNLIWISGGIPFDPTFTTPQMQKTATLLSATQIAVYPIDVRGVAFLMADGAAPSTEVFAPYGGSYDEMSGQNQELLGVHETMTHLAWMTGGHAYFNRNELPEEIKDIVDSGSRYYTLAYSPKNDKWNGKFRKVTVKAAVPNVRVKCRPGYYAVPDPLGSPDINRTFSLAMQPTAPISTTLIIKARVVPPEEPAKPTQIDFLVDVHDLSMTELSDHQRAPDVMFVAAVWDAKGKPGGSASATFNQHLTPAQFASLLRTGLQLHQEMALKPGTYDLRLGVVDRQSGKIGTLDVPLTVESKLAKE